MSKTIIGIAGIRGSGKNEVANIMEKNFGFKQTAFANPLKEAAKIVFNLSDSQVYGSIVEKEIVDPRWNLSPREILQQMGTGIARKIYPDIWVKRTMDHFIDVEPHDRWVISDLRFLNEAVAIKDRGGLIIRVDRDMYRNQSYGSHQSELEVNKIIPDIIIDNNQTLEDLHGKVIELFKVDYGQKRIH